MGIVTDGASRLLNATDASGGLDACGDEYMRDDGGETQLEIVEASLPQVHAQQPSEERGGRRW